MKIGVLSEIVDENLRGGKGCTLQKYWDFFPWVSGLVQESF
jgi:hypothetical protein